MTALCVFYTTRPHTTQWRVHALTVYTVAQWAHSVCSTLRGCMPRSEKRIYLMAGQFLKKNGALLHLLGGATAPVAHQCRACPSLRCANWWRRTVSRCACTATGWPSAGCASLSSRWRARTSSCCAGQTPNVLSASQTPVRKPQKQAHVCIFSINSCRFPWSVLVANSFPTGQMHCSGFP